MFWGYNLESISSCPTYLNSTKNSQVISILVKMGQKMDTCCEDLYACPGTIPAHIHLSSYDKDKEGNEKK